jgi:hypothetical protein
MTRFTLWALPELISHAMHNPQFHLVDIRGGLLPDTWAFSDGEIQVRFHLWNWQPLTVETDIINYDYEHRMREQRFQDMPEYDRLAAIARMERIQNPEFDDIPF